MDKVVNNKKGFTIIELLVALVIFSIAMLGLVPGVINVIKINKKNEIRDKATRLLAQKKSELYQQSFDNFSSIDNFTATINYDNQTFVYRYWVDNESDNLKKTVLNLTYNDPYSKDNRTITSIIYLRK